MTNDDERDYEEEDANRREMELPDYNVHQEPLSVDMDSAYPSASKRLKLMMNTPYGRRPQQRFNDAS